MFLKFFTLRKKYFTSPAVRYSYYFKGSWLNQQKYKKLSLYKKWKSGRGTNGKIILWTRGSLRKKNKIININYSLRYLRLGFIATFQFIPFKNKLVSLVLFANGAATYYLTSENQKLFSLFFYNLHKKFKRFKFKSYRLMLCQIKKLSKISILELYPGLQAQYCRSTGSFGKIIRFDDDVKNVLITLPSGFKKLFSYYTFAFTTKIVPRLSFKCTSSKAGYWRNFGLKSIVRGVAMNPVDHPHGGRTKAVRYQRTPWGKTTKFK